MGGAGPFLSKIIEDIPGLRLKSDRGNEWDVLQTRG